MWYLIVVIIILIIYVKAQSKINEKFSLEDRVTHLETDLKKGIYSKPGPKGEVGPKGDIGVTGPSGPAGAKYTNNGSIRSVAYPDLRIERLFGKGARLWLNKPQYATFQEFMHKDDGTIVDRFQSMCLTGMDGGDVQMNICGSGQGQKWSHSPLNELKIGNKCLTASKKKLDLSVQNSQIKDYKPSATADLDPNTMFLSLVDCDNSTEQQWVFY